MGRLGRLNDISTSSKDNKAGCVQLVNATTAFLTYLCCFSIKGLVVLIAVSLAATVSLLTLRDSLQHGGWGIIRDCRLLFSARGNGAFLGLHCSFLLHCRFLLQCRLPRDSRNCHHPLHCCLLLHCFRLLHCRVFTKKKFLRKKGLCVFFGELRCGLIMVLFWSSGPTPLQQDWSKEGLV